MSIYFNGKKYVKTNYKNESDLEDLVCENAKRLFGEKTIYIDAKRKINSGELGKTIPDGLLFDLSDSDNPKFYLVEVELAKHSFYSHIFPQITKFFAFLREGNSFQSELIDFLYRLISSDQTLLKEFKKHLGDEELFKFLKDVIENSTDILILIDNIKSEFEEIKETYTDTWDKFVKILCLTVYSNNGDRIIQIEPDFEFIKEDIPLDNTEDETPDEPKQKYTEEYHLDGVKPEIKDIYYSIRSKFTSFHVNPQRYYISFRSEHNFVFIKIGKSKIRLVIMLPFDKVQKALKFHKAKEPSLSVQKFYYGKCVEVTVDSKVHLDEIVSVLEEASKAERIKIPRD